MSERSSYRQELEEDVAFLKRNLESLERDKRRLPWLLLAVPAAVPVGLLFGWFFGAALAIAGIVFVLSGFYIVSGHGSEYGEKLRAREAELARLR